VKPHRKSILAALALAALAVPAAAHHSYAMFEMNRTVQLDAQVTRFKWQNPHAFIEADVAAPGGATEHWAIEMTSPNNLAQEGWKRTSLKPGDRVRIWSTRCAAARAAAATPACDCRTARRWAT